MILALVLIALPVPLALRAARRDPDPRMVRLIVAALWVKLLGTAMRYIVIFHVYGTGDAALYHSEGAKIAAAFRNGQFEVEYGFGGQGSRFVQLVTGWVYTFIGPNRIAGFIVFSWMSFLGLYLFYKAFRLAAPAADHRRYAVLLFFLPSLAYWPSSLGKEAWMTLSLGVTAYGVARLLARRRGAFIIAGIGLWGTVMVRPHITLAVIASLIAAYLLRRSRTRMATVTKCIGLVVVLGAAMLVLSRAQGFFGLDRLNSDTAGSVLEEAQNRTGQGGSAFAGEQVKNPLDFPRAAVTVLFRPFPFEAHNFQVAVSSLEGLILLALCLWSLPRMRSLPRQVLRTPYVAFALTFTVVFIVAFSSINNFGILARERVQVFPLLLALLCATRPGSGARPGAALALSEARRPRFVRAGRT